MRNIGPVTLVSPSDATVTQSTRAMDVGLCNTASMTFILAGLTGTISMTFQMQQSDAVPPAEFMYGANTWVPPESSWGPLATPVTVSPSANGTYILESPISTKWLRGQSIYTSGTAPGTVQIDVFARGNF